MRRLHDPNNAPDTQNIGCPVLGKQTRIMIQILLEMKPVVYDMRLDMVDSH